MKVRINSYILYLYGLYLRDARRIYSQRLANNTIKIRHAGDRGVVHGLAIRGLVVDFVDESVLHVRVGRQSVGQHPQGYIGRFEAREEE